MASSSGPAPTCLDQLKNGGETGVDCGGPDCAACDCSNVVCPAGNQCLDPGTCDPLTGACSDPVPHPLGESCNAGNACTDFDVCINGICSEGRPIDCFPSTECRVPTCDPLTGCGETVAANGTPCTNGGCFNGACNPDIILNAAHTGACYKLCTFDSECTQPEENCRNHQCRTIPGKRFCANIITAGNQAGDRWDCGPFRCDPEQGICRRSCATTDDCNPSSNCQTPGGACIGTGVYGLGSDVPRLETVQCGRPACSTDADCHSYENCRHGQCMASDSRCTGPDTFTDMVGVPEYCGPLYRCDPLYSQFGAGCVQSCLLSDDCMPGHYCNANNACE